MENQHNRKLILRYDNKNYPLAQLTKKIGEKTQIHKIRYKSEKITTKLEEITKDFKRIL